MYVDRFVLFCSSSRSSHSSNNTYSRRSSSKLDYVIVAMFCPEVVRSKYSTLRLWCVYYYLLLLVVLLHNDIKQLMHDCMTTYYGLYNTYESHVFETYSNHQSILEYLLGHRRGIIHLGSSIMELWLPSRGTLPNLFRSYPLLSRIWVWFYWT